ncbi:MAG: DUF814 domain-containing protein [Planctomycetes bacterium]|nr:DUF814 domain-containing protein [Planctomycetota bacterium]
MVEVPASRGAPAPGGLRPEEIDLLVTELEPVLIGARLEKVFDRGPHGLIFRWSSRAAEDHPRQRTHLLVSTRPGFTRFHVTAEEPSTAVRPTESTMILRELLRGAIVESIDRPGGDRLVRFQLRLKRDDARIQRSLIFELFGREGRVIVFDTPTRRIRWLAGREGLRIGHSYRFAPAPPKSDTLGFPFDPTRLIAPEQRGEPLAFHRALDDRMARAEQQGDLDEAKVGLFRRINTEIKRRRTLLTKVAGDLERANDWESLNQTGELLKAELSRIARGQSRVQVVDYYDPDLARREVELDPLLSPTENVESYFKRSRKRRRAIPLLEARRAECESDLELLGRAKERLSRAGTAEEIDIARESLDRLLIREKPRQNDRSRKVERRRRYRTREGLEILVGRNARENDRLSITIAKGNDLFFHRADRPGPHVILRVPKGKSPAPESLEDAAFIAAYFSGWRGPSSARVHFTQAKYVRKPKGLPPGKVLISREKEFLVEYRPERLESIVCD